MRLRAFLVCALVLTAPAPGQERVLFADGFEGEDALGAWTAIAGATTGEGPQSNAGVQDGALVLWGDETTTRWLALTRTVDVSGVKWIRVSARMRTENVDADKARYRNCNLFWQTPSGIQTTRILSGTQEWTEISRRAPVPEGVSEITLGCFLSMPGTAWFDDVKVEAIEPPAWETKATGQYEYFFLPGDDIDTKALLYNEQSVVLLHEFFGMAGPERIHYYKYPDLDTIEELTGRRGNAFANVERNEIHSIWASDRHEIVHLWARPWGDPPALLGEGIAVYLSGQWQGKPVKEAAREILEGEHWIPLERMIDTASFRQLRELSTYGQAGALVAWIVEVHGKSTLKELYGRMDSQEPADWNRKVLEELLGAELPELEKQLGTWIGES